MAEPRRIQLRRTKGWRLADASDNPNGVVIVDRRTRYGNPFAVERLRTGAWAIYLYGNRWGDEAWPTREAAVVAAVDLFESHAGAMGNIEIETEDLEAIRGKDLACWCPLDGSPCHADVLLAMANH